MNSKAMIIKDVEKLMVSVIKDEIPKRNDLKDSHTLKSMKLWNGADISIVEDLSEVPGSSNFYPRNNYLISGAAYELSWVFCELRDIYIKNKFYDYSSKYILFKTFADNYTKNLKKINRMNRQWLSEQDRWLLEKSFILSSLQDLIYSERNCFLPCSCGHDNNKSLNNDPFSTIHLGAES